MNNINENAIPLINQRISRLSNLERKAIFKEHPYRFVSFIIYLLNIIIIGTMISAYTPINEPMMIYYGVGNTSVVISSSSFLLGNILFSVFVYYCSDKFGLTLTIDFAMFLGFIGTLIRYFSMEGYLYILVG